MSAGWTVSNEPFFQNNVNTYVFNFLKLRASWGVNGNVSVLSGYRYDSTINYGGYWYQYDVTNTTPSYGSRPSGLANPNLKWETSEQIDAGIDARFLNNRLTFTADWYKKNTRDLLVNVTPPAPVGVSSMMMNAGAVLNTGLEFELGWKDTVGDFRYSVNANFSTLKNKVTYLDPSITRLTGTGPQGVYLSTQFEQGYPIYYMRGLKCTGIDPATGKPSFEDVDGDGNIDTTNDMQMIGLGIPDYTFGVTVNLAWKGFDMVIFGTGVAGNEIFPSSWRTDRPHCNTYSWYWENCWDVVGDKAKFPAVKYWDQSTFSSTLNLFDGSFFKIKQVQLGYTLPRKVLSKVSLSNMRLFVSLENFFTFSSYPGLDPETATANTASSIGIDMGTYPTAKQLIFGVNLSF